MIRRYLKYIALGLILLPEPVTTPVGILLLLIVLAIPGHKKLSKFKNLEELTRKSFKTPAADNSECWTLPEKHVVHHELKGQVEPTHVLNQAEYSTSTWFDNRSVTGKVLYHTLKNSIPQYEASALTKTANPAINCLDTGGQVPAHTLKNSISQYEASASTKTTNPAVKSLDTKSDVPAHTLKTANLPLTPWAGGKTPAADGWKRQFYTPDEVVLHTLKNAN
jgi:hypothetical protein